MEKVRTVMSDSRIEKLLKAILGQEVQLEPRESRVEDLLYAILTGGSHDEPTLSEMEDILLCILHGERYEGPTSSRINDMLKVKANGGSYDEPRLSRIEELIYEWINGGDISTYTGTLPAVLHTVAGFLESYKIWGNTGGVGNEAVVASLSEPLCGIDGHADSIDLSTGTLTRKIGKLELTGEEQCTINNPNTERAYFSIPSGISVASRSTQVCTYYQWNTITATNEQIGIYMTQTGVVRIRENAPSQSQLSNFKSYLAAQYANGTPVTIWYVLAEPEISTVPVPSGFTGTIEGYLIQDGTPTPESPIYPTANGIRNADDTYSIQYGYKLPILSNDTATDIYIGDTQLAKDEYVDSETKKIYKFKEVHKDTVTINGIVWDILGYNHDEVYNEDGTLAQHTVTIQTHDCVDDLQFDAREALFAFPDGLAAGSYTFTIKAHNWVSTDVNKSLTFTLTQAVPKGGQLVVSQDYNASFTTGNISSYASSSATEPIETVKMNEGDTGTSLGDVTNAIVDNTNSCQRALFGSNRWGTSALKQLLNSDKAAETFWKAQTVFDRPPSWAANTAGFLYGMDPDFVSVLGKTRKRTALNTVSDGGGYEDSVEKVFLLSMGEVYAGKENNINEGDPYDYFKDFSDFSAPSTGKDTNRVKYGNGTAKYWWLRSPYTGYASHVRYVYALGEVTTSRATYSYGVAPACCIILDDMPQNTWLQDHFLKPTDPPAPLPQIPTTVGKTVIEYGEEGVQPEKVELKYR